MEPITGIIFTKTESEDGYEMVLSLYQQKDKKEEIQFSSYDTGTVDTDDWQTD